MLAPSWKVCRDIRRMLLVRGLSQRQLAAQAGFRQPYLAQVEAGVRSISGKFAVILEEILGVKRGRFVRGVLGRGRQGLMVASRSALRELRRGLRDFMAGAEVCLPKYAQPQRVERSDDPLWPMSVHLGESAGQEVRLLSLRVGDQQEHVRVRLGLLGPARPRAKENCRY